MATFPKDIPAFRDALLVFAMPAAPEGATEEKVAAMDASADAIEAAHATTSPVVQMVQVYDALKPHSAEIGDDGRKLLAGAAYLINQGQFFGKGAEAFDTLNGLLPSLAD